MREIGISADQSNKRMTTAICGAASTTVFTCNAAMIKSSFVANQLPKAAKPFAQLISPLVAPLADQLLEIVGRQHGGTVSWCNPGS